MESQQRTITNYQRLAKLLTKNYIRRIVTPDCISILPELNLSNNIKILDVGCRNGRLLFKLASFLEDCQLYGIDIEPKRIQKNQARNRYKNLHFRCAPAENLPFENGYFDIICCTNAIHKFPQRVRALDEMHRVLKSNGELYILEAFRDDKWKNKLDKILRQSRFIRPEKKFLPRTAIFSKSYFIQYTK
jgi:ubiquinone/menaquinone biosynthesis C-methylase UbiE